MAKKSNRPRKTAGSVRYSVRILDPASTQACVINQLMSIRVAAQGPTRVRGVYAETYTSGPAPEATTSSAHGLPRLPCADGEYGRKIRVPRAARRFKVVVVAVFHRKPGQAPKRVTIRRTYNVIPTHLSFTDPVRNTADILLPPSGNVTLQNGTVYTEVLVNGPTLVRAVYAQHYTGSTPPDPEDPNNEIGWVRDTVNGPVYGGDIPAILGTFRIVAKALFEPAVPMGPTTSASDNDGDYVGQLPRDRILQ